MFSLVAAPYCVLPATHREYDVTAEGLQSRPLKGYEGSTKRPSITMQKLTLSEWKGDPHGSDMGIQRKS